MNSRERVQLALNHQEPDRVPLALGGGPYGVVDELYLKLLELLALGEPVPPFRTGHNISYMDDRLLEKLGTDTRYCWPGMLPNTPLLEGPGGDTFYDSYGQVWKRALPYYYAGDGVLSKADSPDDIDRMARWPDLADPRWTEGLLHRAQYLYDQGEHYVIMRMVSSHGPFQTACDLRGTEQFLMDLSLRPEFAEYLLDKITTSLVGLLRLAMQTAGRYFDMIELPGDDYAGNNNLLISPRMFRRFVSPCIQRMVKVIREYNPGIKIMLHSDGVMAPLIPDLISLGIDVLHPLEPLPIADLAEVKRKYGDALAFIGGIDISHAMIGSEEDVRHEVQERIGQLAPGGGYILAPSNHLQADVPPRNVVGLFQMARQYGSYPITPAVREGDTK